MSSCFDCCYDDSKKSMSVKNTSITIFLVSSLSSTVLVWSSLLHIGNIQHRHQKKQGTATDCSGCRKIRVHPWQRISTYRSNNAYFFNVITNVLLNFHSLTSVDSYRCDFYCSARVFWNVPAPPKNNGGFDVFGQFSKFFCQPEKFRSHLPMSSDDRFWSQNK